MVAAWAWAMAAAWERESAAVWVVVWAAELELALEPATEAAMARGWGQ